jgi:hypothetical protein
MGALLDWLAKASAALVLVSGVWVVFARDVAPQLGNIRIGGIDRSPGAELDGLPRQSASDPLAYLEAMRQIRDSTPADSYFLIMWQNPFAYYSGRRFIRDVDPRMVSFYRAQTQSAALAELRRLGVDHVFLPPWPWPTVLHSQIRAIAEDPHLASLMIDVAGYRVYRLIPAEAQ